MDSYSLIIGIQVASSMFDDALSLLAVIIQKLLVKRLMMK